MNSDKNITANFVQEDGLSIDGNSKEIKMLHVYPNPGSSVFQIIYNSDYTGVVQIQVFSFDGNNIFSNSTLKHDTTLSYELNLSEYPSGIYIVRVISQNTQSQYKIVKE
jgi:hypothetical protein